MEKIILPDGAAQYTYIDIVEYNNHGIQLMREMGRRNLIYEGLQRGKYIRILWE